MHRKKLVQKLNLAMSPEEISIKEATIPHWLELAIEDSTYLFRSVHAHFVGVLIVYLRKKY